MIQTNLIVATEAPRFVKPAKGSLDDPALGQDLEALGVVTASHNLQLEFAVGAKLFDPVHQPPQVAAIGPDDLNAVIHREHELDETLGRVAVLHGSRGDGDSQNHS